MSDDPTLDEQVQRVHADGVTWITLNRPDAGTR